MTKARAGSFTTATLSATIRVLACATPMLAFTLFPASASHAQDSDDERARLHFSAGRSYYEEGNYEQALEEFQRSYDLSQRAVLLVNIANSQERLGQWRAAADSLTRFLETLPETDEQRPTLQRRIENLRQRAEQHEAGAPVSTTPTDTPETTTPTETPAPVHTTPGSDGLLVPSIIAFGVGGAGLIAFATLGGLALAEESSVADGCGATRSCTPAQVSGMDDLALGADIALAIGVAGVVTGTVLILVDPPRGPRAESATARVIPILAPTSAGALVQGSF